MPVQPLGTSMRFPAGGRLGGAEGYQVVIQVNTGDVMKLQSRLNGTRVQISKELRARGKHLVDVAVRHLDQAAPVGAGGVWRRGDPPLRGSHRGVMIDAFNGVVYTEARHARFIVLGFAAHMPPEEAWLGPEEMSFVMRRAVLRRGTPRNPRDYFAQVQPGLDRENVRVTADMAPRVIPPA